MNIFYLDFDVVKAAKQLSRIHVSKMAVEQCQMLSTAHHVLDGEESIQGIMKKTHENHPDNHWMRKSKAHYNWLYNYTMALLCVYEATTGKVHGCSKYMDALAITPKNMKGIMFSEPPKCVDDDLKHLDTVTAYQLYLKRKYSEWQSREKPLKVEFAFGIPDWMK